MIITCAACSAHACCCRDRCHALSGPSSLPSPSRSVRKAVITLVLHSTIMSLHVSQLHVSQLNVSQMHVVMHAADMRHARTDARTATVTSRALSALVCVSSTWSPSVWCRA
jgi:hypothetical protein